MNLGRALYVGNHCIKSFSDPDPIRIVSRRPALGGGWLSKYWEELRKGFVTVDGRKLRIPPSYLARPEYRDELAGLRERRREFAAARPVLSVAEDSLRRESGRLNVIARSKLARGKL